MTTSPQQITQLLVDWSKGDKTAFERLMPLVYQELRRLAHQHMRRERSGHLLQTTDLIHEAYLRLADYRDIGQTRTHFFALAAQLMRRILVEHARAGGRLKRGGGGIMVALDEGGVLPLEHSRELVELDEALSRLAGIDPRKSEVVELRFFAGLSYEEMAAVLGRSTRSLKRDWRMAEAWLRRELTKG